MPNNFFNILFAFIHEKMFFINMDLLDLMQRWLNINQNFHFSGEALNKYYFPILIPIGILGNILSFLVSGSNIFYIGEQCLNDAVKWYEVVHKQGGSARLIAHVNKQKMIANMRQQTPQTSLKLNQLDWTWFKLNWIQWLHLQSFFENW